MRLRTWIIGMFAAIAMLALGGTALAQQGQSGGAPAQAENRKGAPGKARQAAEHVMHAHHEAFIEGRVVKVDTDRGSVVSTTDNSIELKFEDGSQARIETVGQVHACVDGNRDAKITDLGAGDHVRVNRATNTPKGDHTLVVKESNNGNGRNCRPEKGKDAAGGAGEAPPPGN